MAAHVRQRRRTGTVERVLARGRARLGTLSTKPATQLANVVDE